MDVLRMLVELRSERQRIDESIIALERQKPPRKKRVFSPQARAKMAAAQKRRWAVASKANPSVKTPPVLVENLFP
jgi:hypothetical protein